MSIEKIRIDAAIKEARNHGYYVGGNELYDAKRHSVCPIGAVMMFGDISLFHIEFCRSFIAAYDGGVHPSVNWNQSVVTPANMGDYLGVQYRKSMRK